MAGLIKRLFGRGDDVGPGPDGVPAAWVRALDVVLAEAMRSRFARRPLDPADAQRIRDFVLHGDDERGPAQLNPVFDAFFTTAWEPSARTAARPLYSLLDEVPAGVALRWARVLDAVHGPGRTTGEDRFPDGTWWPFHLMCHALDVAGTAFAGNASRPLLLSTAAIERLVVEAGWDPSALVVAVVLRPREWDAVTSRAGEGVRHTVDFPAALRRHAAAVRDAFPAGPIGAQGIALAEALHRADDDLLGTEFAALVARLATSSSKTLRTESAPLVRRAGGAVVDALGGLARSGGTPDRRAALEALHDRAVATHDRGLLDEVAAMALADKVAGIRALGEGWAAVAALEPGVPGAVAGESSDTLASPPPAAASGPVDRPGHAHAVPEPPVVDWRVEPTPEVRAAIDALWAEYEASVEKVNNSRWYKASAGYPTDDDKDAFLTFLASPEPHPRKLRGLTNRAGDVSEIFRRAARGPLGAIGVVKFMRLFTGVRDWDRQRIVEAMQRGTDRPTLLECVALFESDGVRPQHLLAEWCEEYRHQPDPGPETVRGFFTRYADLVDAALTRGTGLAHTADRLRLYRGIATQPVIPASTVTALLPIALSGPKAERAAAQETLRGVPGLRDRIVAGLSDGRSEVRAAAARWLGRAGDAGVVPLLEKAFAKEKQDVARAGILDGLELLGCDLARYLGRDHLPQEAAKGLARGVPAALAWFDPATLPAVHWADGTLVPDDVVLWLLVRSVKAKSAEPDAILRRYCALLDPADRDALGRHLLGAWVTEDTRPPSEEEALRGVREQARLWGLSGAALERQAQEWLPAARRQPAGSAIDSKGVLAVAAACGGSWAAPVVSRYLKDWYGMRAAQCRALLGMLAHVDDPSAIQVVLATSVRFRTKGIQDEALRLVTALAERRGWTIDELADRTIPTGGFDADGVLALDYGPRAFTARLGADLAVALRGPDGSPLKALPDPRQDDDADLVAEAKKVLSAAKKEVKTVAAQQTARFHEAMCTGRVWPADDWRRYLAGHPVVRHLVQRLVWLEVTDDASAPARTFRPLDDGTLTDAADEPVELAPDARVRLAHDALLPAPDVERWTAHLADYEVAPLFGQLGQGFWALPTDQARATELRDVEGHVLEAFALRGKATKLGWVRGAAEDGGVFTTYRKRFGSVGVDAVLEFTGNALPEENRTVALVALWFARSGDDVTSYGTARLPLGDVPPVLLSECRREAALVAADGPGYDPDWQKATAW